MKTTLTVLFALSALPALAPAAESIAMGKMLDGPIGSAESEIVRLVEAMPANQFSFAPTQGEFKTVRSFGLQARHIATVVWEVTAASNQEKPPVDIAGKDENGPESLRTKEQIVKYMKDAFAYAHKSFSTLTAETAAQAVKSPFGDGMVARGSLASIVAWHSFDHYGQMVVYARMNGVVPPASR
jgi:uncharacterized damage-inducible protein DinB